MRKVGKPKDAVDQRDAERPQRQLATIGNSWDDQKIEKENECVDNVQQRLIPFTDVALDRHLPGSLRWFLEANSAYPPRKDCRTSGFASNAGPLSVKRLRP